MWSFYVFMMWFLSITLWKNFGGAIFAKIWTVVTFFGHFAHKREHPSQDEADSTHKPEHSSQDEADSVHRQNLPNHEVLEKLLSELTDIKSLGIEIFADSSCGQFLFRHVQRPHDVILAQTEDHKTYFAVLNHISSSVTLKTLEMTLKLRDGLDSSTAHPTYGYNFFHPLKTTSKQRQRELLDHLEAFWKALASNKSLEEVYVHVGYLYGGQNMRQDKNSANEKDSSGVGIANWIAMVLSENKTISNLHMGFNGAISEEAARVWKRGLLANRTLKSLKLSPSKYNIRIPLICGESMKILLEPFNGRGDRYNTVLEHLRLGHLADDSGVKHIAAMLNVNDSLKSILLKRDDGITNNGASKNGISEIGDALYHNHTLHSLAFDWMKIHPNECQRLFKPLMQDDSGSQVNTSLKTLNFFRCQLEQDGFEYLTTMIKCNTSLIKLDVSQIEELNDSFNGCEENVCLLLESLKVHPSIESLRLFGSRVSVQGDKVLGTFMDLLLENNHLQEVDLRATPLYISGNAEKILAELKSRREENSWEVIKDMAKARENLFGRIFLCGDGEAGKTTLCTTMKQICEMKKRSKLESSHESQIPLFSSPTKMDNNERTRGIEVHNLSYNDLDLTIWDMAGQEEYHSFHDLVIPNLSGAGSACTFILVCNPLQGTDLYEIKSRLQYWLQFIASNTRKSYAYRPRVTITMTHYDSWSHKDVLYHDCLKEEVETLKKQFNDLLEFDKDKSFYSMDARQSHGNATQLFEFMFHQMKSLLEKLPKVLKACIDLQGKVRDWNIQHPNQPLLSWKEFSCICDQVQELKAASKDVEHVELVERRRKLVALSLHDGGHIIYNEGIQCVIMNPHWFCHDVMGELLSKFHGYVESRTLGIISKGSITRVHFEKILSMILENIGDEHLAYIKDFISIMTKLQVCYDQGDDTFMVPSTLPQGGEPLKWPSCGETMKTNYIGRRLAPKDMQRTILSAGFFPRLQVFFQGKIKDDNTRKSYKLSKDTISFIENGKEVIIEYDGHIDVMVRSVRHDKDILLQFLHDKVFGVIHELLRNPTLGCPGVVLVECVLQPLCVKQLIKKEHRKDQFVLLETLKSEVLKRYDLDYSHNWNYSEEMGQAHDNATDLLGQVEWARILERRHQALEEIGKQVLSDLPSTSVSLDHATSGSGLSEPDEEAQNPMMSEIHSLKEMVDSLTKIVIENQVENMRAFDEIKSGIDAIKSLIQQQDKMLYSISASINESMQFSVELQKSHIPKLAFLAIRPKGGKKQLLVRKFIPELTKCDLHFFCEHIGGNHEVIGQKGCEVSFGTEKTKLVMCLYRRGLQMATILTKVVAHVGGGMGSVVPDFAHGASLILDTPGLLDHPLPSTSSVHILSEDLRKSQVISDEERKDAEQWLIKKVKSYDMHEIHDMFGLNKVKHNCRHFGGLKKEITSIAWVCDEHRNEGLISGTLEPLSSEIQLYM